MTNNDKQRRGGGIMEMFAIIYNPTGVPVGLFVDSQNASKLESA